MLRARPGKKINKLKTPFNGETEACDAKIAESAISVAIPPSIANRTQYQYSERMARPENVT